MLRRVYSKAALVSLNYTRTAALQTYLNSNNANERVEYIVEGVVNTSHQKVIQFEAIRSQHCIRLHDRLMEHVQLHEVTPHSMPLRPHASKHEPDGALLRTRTLLQTRQQHCIQTTLDQPSSYCCKQTRQHCTQTRLEKASSYCCKQTIQYCIHTRLEQASSYCCKQTGQLYTHTRLEQASSHCCKQTMQHCIQTRLEQAPFH